MTEARETLQKALEISEVLLGKLNYVNLWLQQTEKELETPGPDVLSDRVKEMKDMKKEHESLYHSYVVAHQLLNSLTASSAWSGISNQTMEIARLLVESLRIDIQEKQG